MFVSICASILLSIRNIVFKIIPPTLERLELICATSLIWGIIGAFIYPFLNFKTITSDTYVPLISYSILGFFAQMAMQYAFLNSDNVAITAAFLSLNIVFTLFLDSFISGKIKASSKQFLGMIVIIVGTLLTK